MEQIYSFLYKSTSTLLCLLAYFSLWGAHIQHLDLEADLSNLQVSQITLEYEIGMNLTGERELPFQVLCHRGRIPQDIQFLFGDQTCDFDIISQEGSFWKGKFHLSPNMLVDSVFRVMIRYSIEQKNDEKIVIPLILIHAKPLKNEEDTFSANLILSPDFEVAEMFPVAELKKDSSVIPSRHHLNMQVLPSWISCTLKEAGTTYFSMTFFVDLLVVGLLVMAGVVAWRGLEK